MLQPLLQSLFRKFNICLAHLSFSGRSARLLLLNETPPTCRGTLACVLRAGRWLQSIYVAAGSEG